MTPIPPALRREIEKDPFMVRCIHSRTPGVTSPCRGRITWEHAWKYSGRRINEKWAIVPCCEGHNVGVSGREKKFNKYIALRRATPEDLQKYPKMSWLLELAALESEFSNDDVRPFLQFFPS